MEKCPNLHYPKCGTARSYSRVKIPTKDKKDLFPRSVYAPFFSTKSCRFNELSLKCNYAGHAFLTLLLLHLSYLLHLFTYICCTYLFYLLCLFIDACLLLYLHQHSLPSFTAIAFIIILSQNPEIAVIKNSLGFYRAPEFFHDPR